MRFLSPDLLLNINRYDYCYNNSVNKIDFWGLFSSEDAHDFGQITVGLTVIAGGVSLIGSGSLATAGTGGAAAPIGIPMATAGWALILTGTAIVGIGATNLAHHHPIIIPDENRYSPPIQLSKKQNENVYPTRLTQLGIPPPAGPGNNRPSKDELEKILKRIKDLKDSKRISNDEFNKGNKYWKNYLDTSKQTGKTYKGCK